MNATLETSTLQFETLMGSTDRAEEHVRSLFDFAARTPFETGPIIEASRMMQTFGGDALNTMEHLQRLGDASAATSAPINDLGFWTGRLFSQLQAGRPFGEAAQRLQELAVLSPRARNEMEALQKSGASASDIFAVFTTDLDRFSGGMARQAKTWSGVVSTFTDSVQIMIADAMRPLFEVTREGIAQLNDVLSSPQMTQAVNAVRDSIAEAFGATQQERVNLVRSTVLTFAAAAVDAALVVKKAWQALMTMWDATRTAVLFVAEAIVNLVGVLVSAASRLPKVGDQFARMGDSVREAGEGLQAMRQDAAAATVESFNAAQGTSELDIALASLSAELRSAAQQEIAVTEQTARMSNAIAGSGDGGAPSAVEATEALSRANKEAAEDFKRMVKGLADQEAALMKQASAVTMTLQEHLETFELLGAELPSVAVGANLVGVEVRALGRDFDAVRQDALGFFGALRSGFSSVLEGITGGRGLGGFLEKLGTGIAEGFGNILSGGITNLLNTGFDLALKGAKALWGGIKQLFGGPSEIELQGRRTAAAFNEQINSMITDEQRLRAANLEGSQQWRHNITVISDAYLGLGRSQEEALEVSHRLWQAEKEGPEAVAAVIAEINAVLAEWEERQQDVSFQVRQTATNMIDVGSASFFAASGFTSAAAGAELLKAQISGARTEAEGIERQLREISSFELVNGTPVIQFATPAQPALPGGLSTFSPSIPFQHGGLVGSMGTDTVPAMLTPGEFVLRRAAVRRLGLPALQALNAGAGGSAGPITIVVKDSVISSDAALERLAAQVGDQIVRRSQLGRRY